MKLCSLFSSLQGEGRFQGYPSDFVRLYGCNFRCSYCDSPQAVSGREFYEKTPLEIAKIINNSNSYDVCITGGEPFCQKEDLEIVIANLDKKRATIETNGSFKVAELSAPLSLPLYFSIDWKTPSSGETLFDESNIDFLKNDKKGWIKFVVGESRDLDFVEEKLPFLNGIELFLSPVFENGTDWFGEAATFVQNHKNIKLQLQLHKILGIK